ncbi:hypothetical protein [Burkholderia ubonensis]|uniref:Phage tail protein n=1 Tax=Burkholderia ubonensis TaxID=101571 RepID=A0ABD4E3D7_9BURK|nr:hypothetical protein [Burkholderia ubonensis]KVN83419.1 hypothetical protein WJ68_16010 [Burkholderia ubonensis]
MTLSLNPKITKAGLGLLPQNNGTGLAVAITHIALGTSLYTLDESVRDFVMLKNEVARYAVTSGAKTSPTSIQLGTTITDIDIGGRSPNGKYIGEIGFFSGNTLFAVWSRADSPLFIKSANFDVPFAYTLDVTVLPSESVTVTLTTDPAGMAAMLNQHEAKSDPHPQYATDSDVAALAGVVATKQPMIGFTPVQQGGGIGQGSNKVFIGWAADASGVKVTIDKTDMGRIAFLNSPAFTGAPTVPTPAPLDSSQQIANTAFVTSAISSALVGSIVWEPRTSARAGYLKLNGALLSRAAFPALWAYAQGSGALVSDAAWNANSWGCFSTGDGSTTFRIPELRGEHLRSWDDGRGADSGRAIGTFQASQNIFHAHGASASAVGDHSHSAWTDSQGWHGHHGWTAGAGSHNHNNGGYTRLLRPPYGGSLTGSDYTGSGSEQAVGPGDSQDIVPVGDHGHEFNTEGAGAHGHNVGIGGAGNHSHAITVNGDGGNEARGRNVALLAMIRYL